MAFVKVVKSKSYFKRYQVKYRRRREGKTDYQARRALVIQDKNKYASPKYRFVVRFTNKDVICQVTKTLIDHDEVMCAAYAHELPQHGLKVGLTNYAAAYATGLLCARRLLKMLKLDEKYPGLEGDAYGEDYNVEPEYEGDDERNPFRCFLDVGLTRTSTGNRVFAAMKGACDGGLDIPHNEKRFAGYADKKLDSDMLRKYILGGHVGEYMDKLEEDEPELYKKHFSKYIAAGINSDNMEETYTKTHASIRANPFKGVKKDYTKKRPVTAEERLAATEAKKALRKKNCKKSYATARLTYDERKAKIEQYKNDRAMAIAQLADDDE